MSKITTQAVGGADLWDELLSISDAFELEARIKRLSPLQIDALITSDGERHYRMLTPAEQATWGAMCGRVN